MLVFYPSNFCCYQVYRYAGIQVYRYAGIQVCRYTGIQVCRYTGMQVYRYTGMQVYRYTGMQVCMYDVLDIYFPLDTVENVRTTVNAKRKQSVPAASPISQYCTAGLAAIFKPSIVSLHQHGSRS